MNSARQVRQEKLFSNHKEPKPTGARPTAHTRSASSAQAPSYNDYLMKGGGGGMTPTQGNSPPDSANRTTSFYRTNGPITKQRTSSSGRSVSATPLGPSSKTNSRSPNRQQRGLTVATKFNVEEERRRLMAVSPKSTTSIMTGNNTSFDAANGREFQRLSTGVRSSQLAAFLETPRVDQENQLRSFDESANRGGGGDAGSPEEGCWLLKKEEIMEARSDQKPVLHRRDPSNARSRVGSLTPVPFTKTTATKSTAATMQEAEQLHQELHQLNRKHSFQRQVSLIPFVEDEGRGVAEEGTKLRFGSTSNDRTDESATPITPLEPGQGRSPRSGPMLRKVSESQVSPTPTPPAASQRRGTGEAIVYGAFKPVEENKQPTRANLTKRGVVVGGQVASSPNTQEEDDEIDVPAPRPTTATTVRAGRMATTAGAGTTPPTATGGPQTTSTSSRGVQVASSLPVAPTPRPKGVDICVGGNEPLPPPTAKTATPPSVVLTAEMCIQTDPVACHPAATTTSASGSGNDARAQSADPFDASKEDNKKNTNDGCCAVM